VKTRWIVPEAPQDAPHEPARFLQAREVRPGYRSARHRRCWRTASARTGR
jgi:hypothetical protein